MVHAARVVVMECARGQRTVKIAGEIAGGAPTQFAATISALAMKHAQHAISIVGGVHRSVEMVRAAERKPVPAVKLIVVCVLPNAEIGSAIFRRPAVTALPIAGHALAHAVMEHAIRHWRVVQRVLQTARRVARSLRSVLPVRENNVRIVRRSAETSSAVEQKRVRIAPWIAACVTPGVEMEPAEQGKIAHPVHRIAVHVLSAAETASAEDRNPV